MLIQWLYSVRGLDDGALALYCAAFRMHAIDGDLLLSLSEKDLEAAFESAENRLLAPPYPSRDKDIQATGVWRRPPKSGDEDLEEQDILITIYCRPAAGKEQVAFDMLDTLDTDWGKLPAQSVTVLTSEEEREFKRHHKALLKRHVTCIVQLARLTASPDVDALAPMVWNLQVCCSVLQCVLQRDAVCCSVDALVPMVWNLVCVCCSLLQCVAHN